MSGKIRTYYDPKPIPMRCWDWSATSDNYEADWQGEETGWVGSHPIGWGKTEEEAIRDYKEQVEDDRVCGDDHD